MTLLMHIRLAEEDDISRLLEVYHSAYRESRDLGFPMKAESASAADLRRWMVESDLHVVESDRTVVGAVRVDESDDGFLKISRLAVHDEVKGQGLGTALLEYVEGIAREDGYDGLRLTTPPEHPYLPAFYRNRGFEVVEPHPLEYRDYDEVVMEKRIDG